MERYPFPKAPFQKRDVEKFIEALDAELENARVSGENVDRLSSEQQHWIDEYAATLSEEDATEFLLMCAAERLFLQKDSPAGAPIHSAEESDKKSWTLPTPGSWTLPSLNLRDLNPAVIGIVAGVLLIIVVLVRLYSLLSS
jgi:hypothetical protein